MKLSFDTLIIFGSSQTALAVARDADVLGIDIIIIDFKKDIAAYSNKLQRFFCVEHDNSNNIIKIVTDIADSRTAIIADSDVWLSFIIKHRAEFQQLGVKILHSDNKTLEICLNKINFTDFCSENDFLIPKQYQYTDVVAEDFNEYPLLLRPDTKDYDSQTVLPKAVVINNKLEYQKWFEIFKKNNATVSTSQSLISPDISQYSVAIVRNDSGEMLSFVTKKIRPFAESCSTGTYVEMAHNELIEKLGRKIIDFLDYYGIAEVEILYNEKTNQAHFIEINARPWLQYALTQSLEYSFLGFLLDAEKMQMQRKIITKKAWLYFIPDLYHVFSKNDGLIRTKKLKFSDYLRTILKPNTHAIWNSNDLKPFIKYARDFFANKYFNKNNSNVDSERE